ncbi:MAG: hypothetical protein ABI321_06085, partial [Polyangia bacterium]
MMSTLVERQPWIVSPAIVLCALFLFLFEVLAGKTKFLKPLRHVLDAAQLVVKPVVAAVFALSVLAPSTVAFHAARGALRAGLVPPVNLTGVSASTWCFVAIAGLVALLAHTVRAAADFAATMTLLPLVDAILSTAVEMYAIGMLMMFAWLPRFALIVSLAQIAVSIPILGWVLRVSALHVHIVLLAMREVGAEPNTPRWVLERSRGVPVLDGWVKRARGWNRFSHVWLFYAAGRVEVVGRRWFRIRSLSIATNNVKWVAAASGLISDEVTVHGRDATFASLGIAKHQDAMRTEFLNSLRSRQVAVDDATGNGERLPVEF